MGNTAYNDRRWKLLYGKTEGMEWHAAELVYARVQSCLPYILTAEAAGSGKASGLPENHLLVVGTFHSNPVIRRYVQKSEIPAEGYLVRVISNEDAPDRQVVLITGDTESQVFYAAEHFANDFLAQISRVHWHPARQAAVSPLASPLPAYEFRQSARFQKRGIWCWGHCILDYRKFAENMARLGLNSIIIWNDFLPVNIRQVTDCFHDYGIEVIFGFSWGWDEGVDPSSEESMLWWRDKIVRMYEEEYSHAGGDGIYFQTFTETADQTRNGVSIAEAAVRWTNCIGAALLERWPELQIQFGLHATSVTTQMEKISRADPRITITWEDCGSFPYAYSAADVQHLDQTLAFTDRMMQVRETGKTGVVLKGQICLDWTHFEHQKGAFLMGVAEQSEIERKIREVRPVWHAVQSSWIKNLYAYRSTLDHLEGAAVYALVEDGMLEGHLWYPTALYASLLWNTDETNDEVLQRVANRTDVELA